MNFQDACIPFNSDAGICMTVNEQLFIVTFRNGLWCLLSKQRGDPQTLISDQCIYELTHFKMSTHKESNTLVLTWKLILALFYWRLYRIRLIPKGLSCHIVITQNAQNKSILILVNVLCHFWRSNSGIQNTTDLWPSRIQLLKLKMAEYQFSVV